MDGAEATNGQLDAVKQYLRVDGDEDDVLISSLVSAAEEYMGNAGVAPPTGGKRKALYELAVCALCLSWYDRREPIITGTIVADNPMLRNVITQLQLTEPPAVSKLDTAGG